MNQLIKGGNIMFKPLPFFMTTLACGATFAFRTSNAVIWQYYGDGEEAYVPSAVSAAGGLLGVTMTGVLSSMAGCACNNEIAYADTQDYLSSLSIEDPENIANHNFDSLNSDDIDMVNVKTKRL